MAVRRAGLTTKIHVTCDALGNPTGFHLTPGQAHDPDGADVLLPNMTAYTIIADKAFDADERVIQPLQQAGKTIVIPPKSNRTTTREYDKDLYQAQHLIENFFRPTQAIPRHRHTLRQTRIQLPPRDLSRRLNHMA